MADSDVEILDSDDDVEIISSSSSSDGGDVDLEDLASEASTRAPGSASSFGLSEDSFERLHFFKPPAELYEMLRLMVRLGLLEDLLPLVLVEFFAGKAELSWAFERLFPTWVLKYDIKRDRLLQDITSAPGFITALILVFRLALTTAGGSLEAAGALMWLRTQCSSWVWLSRSKTGRSRRNAGGDRRRASVLQANCMVSRTCLLMALATAFRVIFGLEQPDSSVMVYFDVLRWIRFILNRFFDGMYSCQTYMSYFNHPCLKGSQLHGSHPMILGLSRNHPGATAAAKLQKVVSKKRDSAGNTEVTGGKDVQSTQEYTPEYSVHLCRR